MAHYRPEAAAIQRKRIDSATPLPRVLDKRAVRFVLTGADCMVAGLTIILALPAIARQA